MLHQLGPIGRLGALATVDELLLDDRTERLCLALAGGTLRGDGEAFGLAAHLGLLLGRDAQVDDGARRRLGSLSARLIGHCSD